MLTVYARRALELPPHVAVGKAVRLAGRLIAARRQRRRDLSASTYVTDGPSQLVARIKLAADQVPASLTAILPALCGRYLTHHFDLLGSGWVRVQYGTDAVGMEGHRYPPGPTVTTDRSGRWLRDRVTPANLPEAERLWQAIEGPYEPIDWHLDFKSGFRWNCRSYYGDITFGDRVGADIKVPWELARLQHLPQIATAYVLARTGRPGFDAPDVYMREIRNQILDFLATNPPRFGVNWVCPMDVGIRAANILLAVDLLRAGGAVLDAEFEEIVASSMAAHARHILANLEWSTAPRSNHYLSDLAGVLYCAIYLPATEETDAWLDFAAHQLGEEIIAQFLPGGGNFEGSTNYHRLSSEIALFSTAALLGVAVERERAFRTAARHSLRVRPPLGLGLAPAVRCDDGAQLALPQEAIARLSLATACVACWSKPNGRPPQIGDTDSGRLFKLHPILQEPADQLQEDLLDHRALLAGGAALFSSPTAGTTTHAWFDGVVINALAHQRKLSPHVEEIVSQSIGNDGDLTVLVEQIRQLPSESRRESSIVLSGFKPSQLKRHAFAEFGLFVLKSNTTFLSLRCVSHYRGEHTFGHYHDDNLAAEVYHNGVDLIADPGSYLYTPVAEVRDRYRGATSHFAPRPQGGRSALLLGLFEIRFGAVGRMIYFGPAGIAAVLEGDKWRSYRAVLVDEERITIVDGCTPGPLADSAAVPVTAGYGRPTNFLSVSLPLRSGGNGTLS